uniref:Reverse transcriptase zinc-binding domain-containing protein n=1 Tax=Fagus sylvatica TaxID=28930 RepID=A0A2N9HJ72_FAGSY
MMNIKWHGWDGNRCLSKSKGGMGFRNLHSFNLAMLAKQGWRLSQNQNSMAYRVYKSKYFPTGNLLQAPVGHNPSYAWRSIWNALEVIRQGSRWRVGNGIRINIWEDRWLPTLSTFKVRTPRIDINDTPQVSSLIDQDSGNWRVEKLNQFFLPMDITAIMSIPLGNLQMEDTRVWIGNSTGMFTVKSAYCIAQNILEPNHPEESSNLRKFGIKVVFQELYPRHVGDIREAMLLLLEKGKSVRIEFFWVVAWNIWWDRNKKIHGDSSGTLHDVLRLARQMMEDFLNLNHEQQASPQSPAWWHAPDNDSLLGEVAGLKEISVLRFSPCDSNRVAHLLAHYAQETETCRTWRDTVPDFLIAQLWRDGVTGSPG